VLVQALREVQMNDWYNDDTWYYPEFSVWRKANVPEIPVSTITQDVPSSLVKQPADIATTLEERGKRYGKFTGHAQITQAIKHSVYSHSGWANLSSDQREALEMIAHKIGRIVNGDPNYADSWHDIAGYAQLVADRLNGVER
jgi:hypothetical protein